MYVASFQMVPEKKWRLIKLKKRCNEVEPTLSTEWEGKQPEFIPCVTFFFSLFLAGNMKYNVKRF